MDLPPLTLDFCGTVVPIARAPFTIGRQADLSLDDNPYLHRRFLTLHVRYGMWVLTNEGSVLSATITDPAGRLEARLFPGATQPLVEPRTIVRFSAGPTSYEFALLLGGLDRLDHAGGDRRAGEHRDRDHGRGDDPADDPDATVGRVPLTPEQLRLVVALAEPALRGTADSASALPSSADVAARLGWTTAKLNRKLDNVCRKLTRCGVRGLHGGPGRLASHRRARLVEYALRTQLVTRDDLVVL